MFSFAEDAIDGSELGLGETACLSLLCDEKLALGADKLMGRAHHMADKVDYVSATASPVEEGLE